MRFVCLFKIRIDDDPAAMLADYELLVGSDVNKTLRSDGVEASTAGVSVIDGHDSEMIVDAGADAVVRAHRPRIDLLGADEACDRVERADQPVVEHDVDDELHRRLHGVLDSGPDGRDVANSVLERRLDRAEGPVNRVLRLWVYFYNIIQVLKR